MNDDPIRTSWRIAGRTIAATVHPAPGVAPWLTSMASHRIPDPAEPPALELVLEPRPGWRNPSAPEGVTFDPPEAERPARVFISGPTLAGELARTDHGYRGSFSVSGEAPGPLEIALRSSLSVLCEQAGELLLHASAVARADGVWLFCGATGAGKSTIALELNGGGRPTAVDRAVLAVDGDGALVAHSTPFSDEDRVLEGPWSGPLAGLCLIEQAAAHRVEPVDPYAAIAALMPQVLTFSRAPAVVERVMATAGKVAESGRCCKLYFGRDERLWESLGMFESDRRRGAR